MAQPASSDHYAQNQFEGAHLSTSGGSEFQNLNGPPMIRGVPKGGLAMRPPAVLIADFKEVVADVRESIQEFLSSQLCLGDIGSDKGFGKASNFGFLATEKAEAKEVTIASVRGSLERAMLLGEAIASHGGEGLPVWSAVQAIADNFQYNTQIVLIGLHNMNVGHTTPSGSLGQVMTLLNQMQKVARQTAGQLDTVIR
jgi:hypothetical protein